MFYWSYPWVHRIKPNTKSFCCITSCTFGSLTLSSLPGIGGVVGGEEHRWDLLLPFELGTFLSAAPTGEVVQSPRKESWEQFYLISNGYFYLMITHHYTFLVAENSETIVASSKLNKWRVLIPSLI